MKTIEKILTAIFMIGLLLSGVFFVQTDWQFAVKKTNNLNTGNTPEHTAKPLPKKSLEAHFLEYQNSLMTFKADLEKQTGEVNESCKKAVALAEAMIADMEKDSVDSKSAAKSGFFALILSSTLILFLKRKTRKAPDGHKDSWEFWTTVTEMFAGGIIYAITAKLLF